MVWVNFTLKVLKRLNDPRFTTFDFQYKYGFCITGWYWKAQAMPIIYSSCWQASQTEGLKD